MNSKLTLRLDDDLIRSAKRYSGRAGKSVSQIVAGFFTVIAADQEVPDTELTPRVRSLLGALAGSSVTEEDQRRHLEDKYR
jgi:antitoxin component of RelBE/YafQ-DinJ toxin-antitoxin module